MPLRIVLKPHEKIFLGGAVVVNGASRTEFMVMNDTIILREKDILSEERADSPCKRIYLAIQLIYMGNGDNRLRYQAAYAELVQEVLKAAPSTAVYLQDINAHLLANRLYQALKAAKSLVVYEQELIDHVIKPD